MDEIIQLQTELLQTTVNRVYRRVPFYRNIMDQAGMRPEDILSIEDLSRLPFTTHEAFSKNYPYGLFAVPLRDIVRIHTLRGIDGTPVVLGYTRQDVEHRMEISRRFLESSGVTSDDIVQICLDPGMSVVAQDLREGAEAIGALVIPPDPISTKARIRVLADFKTTTLITTPSYGEYILSKIEEWGPPIASLSLRRMIVVGEAMDMELRAKWIEEFRIDTRAGYGITEIMGPGMAYECEALSGLHMAMDHFIPEIIDPVSGERLPNGEEGELVVTTITNRANPLIRFRTGDITRIIDSPCPCGESLWRIEPIRRRTDDFVSVRGIKIGEKIVDHFLKEYFGKAPPYCLKIRRNRPLERLELKIALDPEHFTGSLPELHKFLRSLEEAFQETVGISCSISPGEERTVEQLIKEAKGRRIVLED